MVYFNLTEWSACDWLYWNIFLIHSVEISTRGKMQVMVLKRWKEY